MSCRSRSLTRGVAEYDDLRGRGADLIVGQFLDLFAGWRIATQLLAWQWPASTESRKRTLAGLFHCHPSTISRYRKRVEKRVNEAFANNDR